MVVWLGGLLIREAGLGSSIFPSGVRSSRGGWRWREGVVDIFRVGQDNLTSVQRGGLPAWWAVGSWVVLVA